MTPDSARVFRSLPHPVNPTSFSGVVVDDKRPLRTRPRRESVLTATLVNAPRLAMRLASKPAGSMAALAMPNKRNFSVPSRCVPQLSRSGIPGPSGTSGVPIRAAKRLRIVGGLYPWMRAWSATGNSPSAPACDYTPCGPAPQRPTLRSVAPAATASPCRTSTGHGPSSRTCRCSARAGCGSGMGAAVRRQVRSDAVIRGDRGRFNRSDVRQRHQATALLA